MSCLLSHIQVTFKSSVCLLQSDEVLGACWAWLAGRDGPVAGLVREFFIRGAGKAQSSLLSHFQKSTQELVGVLRSASDFHSGWEDIPRMPLVSVTPN